MASFADGKTIKDRLANEVSLLTNATNSDPREEHRKFHLVEALKVIDLFDKVGDSLSSYHESLPEMVPMVKVVEDVADILKKAHIPLTHDDLDFSGFFDDHAQLKKLPSSLLIDGHGHFDNDQSTFSFGAQCSITPSHPSTHKRDVPYLVASSTPPSTIHVRKFSTIRTGGSLPYHSVPTLDIINPSLMTSSTHQEETLQKRNVSYPVACSTPASTTHVRKFSTSRTGGSLLNYSVPTLDVRNPALMTSTRTFSPHQTHYLKDYFLEKCSARVQPKFGGASCNFQASQIKKPVYETFQVPLVKCLTFMAAKFRKGTRFF